MFLERVYRSLGLCILKSIAATGALLWLPVAAAMRKPSGVCTLLLLSHSLTLTHTLSPCLHPSHSDTPSLSLSLVLRSSLFLSPPCHVFPLSHCIDLPGAGVLLQKPLEVAPISVSSQSRTNPASSESRGERHSLFHSHRLPLSRAKCNLCCQLGSRTPASVRNSETEAGINVSAGSPKQMNINRESEVMRRLRGSFRIKIEKEPSRHFLGGRQAVRLVDTLHHGGDVRLVFQESFAQSALLLRRI